MHSTSACVLCTTLRLFFYFEVHYLNDSKIHLIECAHAISLIKSATWGFFFIFAQRMFVNNCTPENEIHPVRGWKNINNNYCTGIIFAQEYFSIYYFKKYYISLFEFQNSITNKKLTRSLFSEISMFLLYFTKLSLR